MWRCTFVRGGTEVGRYVQVGTKGEGRAGVKLKEERQGEKENKLMLYTH